MPDSDRAGAALPDLNPFEFEAYRADPGHNELIFIATGERYRLQPRTMDVLVLLARNAGQVVSREQFVDAVWAGRRVVDDSLSLCVSELRKVLGDDARQPRFIRTVPKRGYCFLPEVRRLPLPAAAETSEPPGSSPGRRRAGRWRAGNWIVAMLVASVVLVFAGVMLSGKESLSPTGPTGPTEAELTRLLSSAGDRTLGIRGPVADDLRIERRWLDGDRARLQLIDGSGTLLWSVERTLGTDSDRRQVRAELRATIDAISNRRTGPLLRALEPELQRLFNRARFHLDRRTESDLAQARELLQQILAQNPEFVDAILGLAEVQEGLARYDVDGDGPIVHGEARRLLIEQARLVDPDHPAVRALVYRPSPGPVDWGQYEADLQNLVSLAPDCVACVRRLGQFYLEVGWYKEALKVWETHLRYWPLSVRVHSAIARLHARLGNYETALRQVKVIRALAGSDAWDVYAAEANGYLGLGDRARWAAVMDRVLASVPGAHDERVAIRALQAGDDARLAELAATAPKVRDFNIALTLGQVDPLVERLRRNVAARNYRDLALVHGWIHEDNPLTHHYLTGLGQLQGDPRVRSLFEEIGLMTFWRERRKFPDFCTGVLTGPTYCG